MPALPSCTAQGKGGKFCDAQSIPDAPFPICFQHAVRIYKHLAEAMRVAMGGPDGPPPIEAGEPIRDQVVYYLEWGGGRVKIGHTAFLHQRMRQLSIPRDQILAVEPGTLALERARHREFKVDRVARNMEIFHRSKAVDEHIAHVKTIHPGLVDRLMGVST